MKPIRLLCLVLTLIFSSAKGQEKQAKSLHQAAADGNIEQVKSLLSRGADVNAKDEQGQTALHLAVVKGHKNIVEFLLAKGAYIEAKDNAWRTPLHYAAGAGHLYGVTGGSKVIAQLLLDKGANINATDKLGQIPLHCCVRIAFLGLGTGLLELLVKRGSDVRIADERGQTPLFMAQEMVHILRSLEGAEKYAKLYKQICDFLRGNGCIYYVATDGEDSFPGTKQHPFMTLSTAISVVEPGDTIIVRGGTYNCATTIHIDKSGEAGKPIRIIAYAGETPVFNFSAAKGEGLLITGAYWRIKGLTITNTESWGVKLETKGAHHNILEQVTSHSNNITGIVLIGGPAYNIIINCDTHRNFDPWWNGENADGFGVYTNIGEGNVLIGCRAWLNSDDGFDLDQANVSVRLENCYAYRNGENIWGHPAFTGNATGFKLGSGKGRHVLICCAAWNHNLDGFRLNNNTAGVFLYNCTSSGNRCNYNFSWGAADKCTLRNNLSHRGSTDVPIMVDSQFNSWNICFDFGVTDNDFLSLYDGIIMSSRNPDGSIPESDFLRLAPGSDLIDAGTDVGLPFVGKAPDLGAFEYRPAETKQKYIKMLHQAVRDHDIEQIQSLISKGTDINEKDWLGYTPLHWAIYFGYFDVAEILIAAGANPNIKSDTGRTPLEIATDMDYNHLAELLRKHGAKE